MATTGPADALQQLFFPSPTFRSFLFDATEDGLPYPYEFFRGRDESQRALRAWLLGGTNYDPQHRPRGGAALVTGFRGAGKSALVDKVLFDVGLAGLLGLPFGDAAADARRWPFEPSALRDGLKRVAHGDRAESAPRVYVPVAVDVANGIAPAELLERVLRVTYHALCRYEIGDLRPDVMRRVRLAYLRTLGKVEVSASVRFVEKLQTVLGANLETLSKLEVTAAQEREFAETFKLVADSLSLEETEDELIELGASLSNAWVGRKKPLLGAARSVVEDAWRVAAARWKEWLRGSPGTQVHLVFVFDELDKLDRAGAPAAGDARLTTARAVIEQLKILFSTTAMSAVVIAGTRAEDDWLDEASEDDPVLRSVFATHLYVPQLTGAEIGLLPGVRDEAHARALAFRTRGRYKHVLRELCAPGGPAPDDDARLAAVVGPWGTSDLRTPEDVLSLIGSESIEELVGQLARSLPFSRRNAYGLDVLRSTLVSAVMDGMAPGAMGADGGKLTERIGRRVPTALVELVVERVRTFAERARGGR